MFEASVELFQHYHSSYNKSTICLLLNIVVTVKEIYEVIEITVIVLSLLSHSIVIIINTTNSIGRESVYNRHAWQYGFLSRCGVLDYYCFPNCSIKQKAGGDIKHDREVYNTKVYVNTLSPSRSAKIERHNIYQVRTVWVHCEYSNKYDNSKMLITLSLPNIVHNLFNYANTMQAGIYQKWYGYGP